MTKTNGSDKSQGQPPKANKATAQKVTKPRKKWKKPADKPKRPLSAYNLFFQQQRKLIVDRLEKDSGPTDDTTDMGRRRHRKTSGVGFKELAQGIAQKWKTLDAASRSAFEAEASKEKERYQVALNSWKEKQEEQKKNGAAEKPKPAPQAAVVRNYSGVLAGGGVGGVQMPPSVPQPYFGASIGRFHQLGNLSIHQNPFNPAFNSLKVSGGPSDIPWATHGFAPFQNPQMALLPQQHGMKEKMGPAPQLRGNSSRLTGGVIESITHLVDEAEKKNAEGEDPREAIARAQEFLSSLKASLQSEMESTANNIALTNRALSLMEKAPLGSTRAGGNRSHP